MKVGIYTLPFNWNYGGILQCYALKEFLRQNGHDVEVLYRRKDSYKKVFNLLKRIKWGLIPIMYRLGLFKHNSLVCCEQFKQKYMKEKSPLFFETSSLAEYCKKKNFGCVIVGSDQIWRYGVVQDIFSSYLDFVDDNTAKIAYAVSFGVDDWIYPEKVTKRCKELASKFSMISVRENTGVKLCENFLGVEAFHVLDPTLLMGYDLFKRFDLGRRKEGLFNYMLDITPKKTEMIKKICDEKKIKAYSVLDSTCNDRSVEMWIEGFSSCDYVITDSFHGTCFAIMFNKQFISIYNKERGNARFESLLESLNLMDRLVDEGADVSNLLKEHIDYSKVNSLLNEKREFSKKLLIDSLNGVKSIS